MFDFLVNFMRPWFIQKPGCDCAWAFSVRDYGVECCIQRITPDSECTHISYYLDTEHMTRLVQDPRFIRITRRDPNEGVILLPGYEDFPVNIARVAPDGSGYFQLFFGPADGDDLPRVRAVLDYMLQWFPRDFIRDWAAIERNRLSMAMALHPRLGSQSALGELGPELLSLVARHLAN